MPATQSVPRSEVMRSMATRLPSVVVIEDILLPLLGVCADLEKHCAVAARLIEAHDGAGLRVALELLGSRLAAFSDDVGARVVRLGLSLEVSVRAVAARPHQEEHGEMSYTTAGRMNGLILGGAAFVCCVRASAMKSLVLGDETSAALLEQLSHDVGARLGQVHAAASRDARASATMASAKELECGVNETSAWSEHVDHQ
jgi:hypothetical protein